MNVRILLEPQLVNSPGIFSSVDSDGRAGRLVPVMAESR